MTQTTIELLPCPFCGGAGAIESNGIGDFFVSCGFCFARTDQARCEELEHAAKRWNRRAALQQQAHGVVIDEGELWSFLRHVLSQGEAIWQDNREKCYEDYSAHLDYAARVRKQQLVAILKGAKRDQAVAAKDGAG